MNRHQRKRCVAWSLLLTMVLQTGLPTTALALTSGPSQPEVQGFSPAGEADIVDLFTGDASYNIPIMDVEGYPINLSYRAGATMDQEASWVGLGWTLSPGQVERNVRGIPDDFRGDLMRREMSMRPNRTVGMSTSLGFELFGAQTPFSLNVSVSPSFNNYDGARMELGATLSMRSTSRGKSGMTAGLGVTASSDGALTMQPSIGYDKAFESCNGWGKGGLNFGAKIGSRDGLSDLSFNASMMRGKPFTTAPSGTSSIGSASFDLSPKVYSPEVSLPMENYSVSANIQPIGLSLWGTNTGIGFGGYYSRQRLATNDYSKQAFGYLNLEAGENMATAMLDFSREGDGPYRSEQSHLGVASLTNDMYSVSSQNMNGSYRPYRASVGHVFDSQTTCSGSGGSFGIEFSAGGAGHLGGDIIVNEQTSTNGEWNAYTSVPGRLKFGHTSGTTPERVFFREANEAVVDRDPTQFTALAGSSAQRFKLQSIGGYNAALMPQFENGQTIPGENALDEREPRGTVFSYLTHKEVKQGFGLDLPNPRAGSSVADGGALGPIKDHHISEITITGKDGARNFYGLPAYNTSQCDVQFAMWDIDQPATLVHYDPLADATSDNDNGTDHFFSKNHTPPHAYAYLLTAAVSADYSDADGVRGPSDGDLGTWHRFHYSLVDPDFHWRTPVPTQENWATAQPGLAEGDDDRATFSYGTKEVWAVHAIEGRNLVAVFYTGSRDDANGVQENGAIAWDDEQPKLDSIGLYTKEQIFPYLAGLSPTPPPSIKTAHFRYDYALCPLVPNSDAAAAPSNSSKNHGKLTLRKLWFTYGASRRGVTSPYKFIYGEENTTAGGTTNPAYNADRQDRWGGLTDPNLGLPSKDFPYATQNGTLAQNLAAAWNLTLIKTPSAGTITVVYEADAYGYVQGSRPTTMFRLAGANFSDPNDPADDGLHLPQAHYLKFAVPIGVVTDDAVRALIPPGLLYFRMKIKVLPDADEADYVSGYAQVDEVDGAGYADGQGWVKLHQVHIDKDEPGTRQPIYRAAIEFARTNYSKQIYHPVPALAFDADDDPAEQFILATAAASVSFLTGLANLFIGPNQEIINSNPGIAEVVDYGASYIKLLSPGGHKYGGGHRVSSVAYTDAWEDMTATDPGMSYGKRYGYTLEDGATAGVAAYEPMIGADENCMRQPVFGNVHRCLSPDQRFYQEYPYAESLYPSPTVGYSRVTVVDFLPGDPNPPSDQMTGIAVHEFYTAKDFPVRADRTSINEQHYTPGSFNLLNLLGFKTVDNMHVSQGMVVETNDMHGKPRTVKVYPQDSDLPISSEEYVYAMDGNHLSNQARVVEPDGSTYMAEIGRHYEFLADLREYRSDATSSGVAINTDVLLLFIPVPVPTPWPKFSSERTRFRSSNFVKKIHRFALLEKVIKNDNGRTTITENLAYDARTGNVLLTKVQNDFNDPVYSMTFPAYWYHDGMGPGYMNIGYGTEPLNFSSGVVGGLVEADRKFVEGDELICTPPGTDPPLKGWVEAVSASNLSVIDADGEEIPNGTYSLRIIRSGRRNMPSVPMTTMTSLSDPLVGMASNTYPALVNVQVAEFSDIWRTACECQAIGQTQPTHNPFILGTRGLWRLNKDLSYLAERTRSTENRNSNIRRDGMYASFDPFYRLNTGIWEKHEAGWVTTREVVDYNTRGQELENRDALGIASSATFGMRGTLVKSIAKNAKYRDQGFDDFEDPGTFDCGDRHFRIPPPSGGAYVTTAAHSGWHSLQVSSASPAVFHIVLEDPCPYQGCTLSVVASGNAPVQVAAQGGLAPFVMSPVPIAGDPVFAPGAGGSSLLVSGTGSFQLTVTDANGCQADTTLVIP